MLSGTWLVVPKLVQDGIEPASPACHGAHPGPMAETVAWILDRDRQTRTKARTLISNGLPWGRALRLSWEHHVTVLWTIGGVGVRQMAPQSITDRNVAFAAAREQEH